MWAACTMTTSRWWHDRARHRRGLHADPHRRSSRAARLAMLGAGRADGPDALSARAAVTGDPRHWWCTDLVPERLHGRFQAKFEPSSSRQSRTPRCMLTSDEATAPAGVQRQAGELATGGHGFDDIIVAGAQPGRGGGAVPMLAPRRRDERLCRACSRGTMAALDLRAVVYSAACASPAPAARHRRPAPHAQRALRAGAL